MDTHKNTYIKPKIVHIAKRITIAIQISIVVRQTQLI